MQPKKLHINDQAWWQVESSALAFLYSFSIASHSVQITAWSAERMFQHRFEGHTVGSLRRPPSRLTEIVS